MPLQDWEFEDSPQGTAAATPKQIPAGWEFEEETSQQQEGPSQESIGGTAARLGTGAASSLLAGLGSVPKGIAQAAQGVSGLASKGIQAATNFELPLVPQGLKDVARQGISSAANIGSGILEQAAENLPSGENIKEFIGKALPEEYLKPKNEAEKLGYDIVETFGSLLFPLGAPAKVAKIPKLAALAGSGEVAKYLTQKVGGSQGAQEAAKIGTMLATGFGLEPSLRKTASDYYTKAQEAIPNGAQISTAPLKPAIEKIGAFASKGFPESVKDKELLNKMLIDMDKFAGGNKVAISELIAAKQDLGKIISNTPKSSRATPFLVDLSKTLNDTIKKNPEVPKDVAQYLTAADEIYKGVAQSNRALSFIKGLPGIKKIADSGSLPILGLGYALASGPQNVAKLAGAGGALYGGTMMGYALKNMFTNPSIRREYAKMMMSAGKQNAPEVLKSAQKLSNLVDEQKPMYSIESEMPMYTIAKD